MVSLFLINLIFGSTLTRFKLFLDSSQPTTFLASLGSQLEAGGSESGQIRLVVWKGAIEIFKHYPIFGSGVETFAYSYYNFRPTEHNLVSEWDFLYNKAHNEFLNYLATTGIIGFLTYMAVILTFIIWSIRFIVHRSSFIEKQKTDIRYTIYDILLPATLLASYTSYLVQNFFGFSVVSVALLFYLFPALAFTATGSTKPSTLPKFLTCYSTLLSRQSFYPKLAGAAVIIIFGLMGFTLIRNYIADIYFATGNQANESGNPGRAYNFLSSAVSLNPGEPYYRSELGYAAAASASVLIDQESTLSAQLKATAIEETNNILESHPKNVSFFRTAIRTFYMLSTIDKEYTEKTLQILNESVDLVLYMVDATRKRDFEESKVLGLVRKINRPKILVINKIDDPGKSFLPQYKFLEEEFKDVFQISAINNMHVKPLLDKIFEYLPEKNIDSEELPPDLVYPIINLDSKIFLGELIREKIFLMMGEEIPYTTTVMVDQIAERKNGITYIKARILTTNDRYKGMLIGKEGRKIKEIGSYARKEIALAINKKVFLDLNIEVDAHWQEMYY